MRSRLASFAIPWKRLRPPRRWTGQCIASSATVAPAMSLYDSKPSERHQLIMTETSSSAATDPRLLVLEDLRYFFGRQTLPNRRTGVVPSWGFFLSLAFVFITTGWRRHHGRSSLLSSNWIWRLLQVERRQPMVGDVRMVNSDQTKADKEKE